MHSVYIRQSNISCLPNRFNATISDTILANYPLCDPSSGCDFFYNISGDVHYDSSNSCQTDSLNPGAPVAGVKVLLRQGGNVMQQFYTSNSGGYSFKTSAWGTYTIDIDTTGLPLSVVCPQSFLRSVAISPADSVKKYENFGMQCSAVDFGVNYMYEYRFRPAYSTTVHIDAGNIALQQHNASCGSGVAGTATTSFTNAAHYVGPAAGALTPSTVSGNALTYTLSDLNTLNSHSLDIILSIDSNAIPGTQVCISTTLTPATTDINTSDNSMTQCFPILNSWDPNHKEVYPTRVQPGSGDWLTYTIHFQNTGNDTAYLVVLKDTLSQYVDAASFQYLASSHHAVIQLDHNAMTFTFPHINLVDSATNPPLSQGWIQYRVRANAGLPNGTAINNTAYIYFDLNPAVVTNTATTAVQLATCVDGDIYDSTTICQGDTFVYGGMTMTTTGFYYNLMQNATGCDTTYHIWLTVLPAAHTTLYDTICAGSSYAFGGHQLTAAGTYLDTLTAAGGCDSIISLALAVRPFLQAMLYDTMCAGSSYAFGGHQLTAAGTYSDTLASAGGCDSIISLTLAVRPVSHLTIRDSICQGFQYVYMNDTLTTSDSLTYVFQNSLGCDSVVTLVLTVIPHVSVTFAPDTMLARGYFQADTAGHLLWWNFANPHSFPLIGGSPPGGHYSGLYVQNDSFVYTGGSPSMISINYIVFPCGGAAHLIVDIWIGEGINDISPLSTIHLYPDPNTGTFTLVTERSYGLSYRVYDVLGKEVIQGTITADTEPIRLPDVAGGVYTISVDGSRPLRFVVVH